MNLIDGKNQNAKLGEETKNRATNPSLNSALPSPSHAPFWSNWPSYLASTRAAIVGSIGRTLIFEELCDKETVWGQYDIV
jgi:hypothetical protein